MNEDRLLQLQAWVDGELPDGEASRLAEWVRGNADAEALVAELRITRSFMAGNEAEVCLPAAESRDFYWSKIARAIAQGEQREQPAEPAAAQPFGWLLAWRRLLAPASGLALVAFVSVLSLNVYHQHELNDRALHLVEVENLSEHVGSISYKSQSENMFVVYLYNRDKEPEAEVDEDFDSLPVDPVTQ